MADTNYNPLYIPAPTSTNVSFSGADVEAYILAYGAKSRNKFIPINNLAAISVSVHRDKSPVRALGTPRAKGYTKGTRTIAGSLVLVNFDRAGFYSLLEDNHEDTEATNLVYGELSEKTKIKYSDDIPPFDILLLFKEEKSVSDSFTNNSTNLSRVSSKMLIKDVMIVDEGSVTGTEEAYMETTYQYVAEDMGYLRPVNSKTSNVENNGVRGSENLPIGKTLTNEVVKTSPYTTEGSTPGYIIMATLDSSNIAGLSSDTDIIVDLQGKKIYPAESLPEEIYLSLPAYTDEEDVMGKYLSIANFQAWEDNNKIKDWRYAIITGSGTWNISSARYETSLAAFNGMKFDYYKTFNKNICIKKTAGSSEQGGRKTLLNVSIEKSLRNKKVCEEANRLGSNVSYEWYE